MSLTDRLKGIFGKTRSASPGEAAGNIVSPARPQSGREQAPRSGTASGSGATTRKSGLPLGGHLAQYPGAGPERGRQQLIIGLDFGTAFTKVIIGDSARTVAYAVPFGTLAAPGCPYLLPGAFYEGWDQTCALSRNSKSERWYVDLKMRFLEGDDSVAARSEATAFLPLVLRHSRAWFLNAHQPVYGNRYIDWLVNIGLPTDNYDGHRLVSRYQQMVAAAWTASVSSDPITLKDISALLASHDAARRKQSGSNTGFSLSIDAIRAFPEFAVQMVGYVRSPLRRPDLHVLVDIGAGTVDVTVFNVHRQDGEDRFPIFAKAVGRLGTRYLVEHRLKGQRAGEWSWSPFDAVPPAKEFARRIGTDVNELDKLDSPFRHKVTELLAEQMRYTKQYRYPGSRRWEKGVPLFLCGGGSRCDFYRGIAERFEKERAPCRMKIDELPSPTYLKAPELAPSDYDRLLVAVGLSFDPDDIGNIIAAKDIENVPPPSPSGSHYTDRYIDKDMV